MAIRNGDHLLEDPDGIELHDLDAARLEALAGAREIVAEKSIAGG